jgi:hypothetical protein
MKNYGELLQSYFIFLHRRLYFSSHPEFQLKKCLRLPWICQKGTHACVQNDHESWFVQTVLQTSETG